MSGWNLAAHVADAAAAVSIVLWCLVILLFALSVVH